MINRKAKGTRRENELINILEGFGFYCTRSAASKKALDIIAFKGNILLLIQSKSNAWSHASEKKRLQELDAPDISQIILARRDDEKKWKFKILRHPESQYIGNIISLVNLLEMNKIKKEKI